ncbi:MAG: SulP family inorganic anion transporter [Phycicoccus sp.]|nr:SulP family inorganic anion transporter [Phycicoccus sp.]
MKFPITRPRSLISVKTLAADVKAALVLGVEGVPDNLSSGVLAGINPVAAVYAGIFGVAGAALFTSSALMPVQATGAMSIIVRDTGVGTMANPTGALATLTLLTGLFMIIAGVLRGGRITRFVSQSVTTGFLAAVGINIILGQFGDLTLYQADGGRVARSIETLLHVGEWSWVPLILGAATAALIVVLRRTRLGGLSYVAAIIVAWLAAFQINRSGGSLPLVRDIAQVPSGLPLPILPDLSTVVDLLLPALSLAFVGLVQGAGVARSVENPDGSRPDPSQDFIGQGAGNIASGLMRGMPVGGSASATVLMTTAGARSRGALFLTAIVMAVLIVALSPLVALVPLSGLAGMLLVVGVDTIPIDRLRRSLSIGTVPMTVTATTFVLTLLIPLQFAVLVGVGVSIMLFAVGEASRLDLRQITITDDGPVEVAPPATLGAREVVIIQPYGTMFFASADRLVEQLPAVTPQSTDSVLILRLRGEQSPSATLIDSLAAYARSLSAVGSRIVVVTTSEELVANLAVTEIVADGSVAQTYLGNRYLGATVRRAYDDAVQWVAERRP